MMFIIGLICYFVMVMIVDADHDKALLRLSLLPLLFIIFKLKPKWDYFLIRCNTSKNWILGLKVLLTLLVIGRSLQFHHKMNKPIGFIEDIAVLNKDAVHTLFREHKNPYTEKINSYVVGDKDYAGYKYPPLQIFTYAPFVLAFGQKGIYAGNLFIYLALCFLIYKILLMHGKFHALLGSILFLGTDYHYVLSFNHGTNDHLPALLMLAALYQFQKNNSLQSGILLGLSLLGKQLPGALLALYFLVYRKFKILAIAAVIFLFGVLPFLTWDFVGFYENTVEFALTRPVRESSILTYMSSGWQKVTQLFGLLIFFAIAKFGKNGPALFDLTKHYIPMFLGIFIFLLTAKMTPAHYFVWSTGVMIIAYVAPLKE